jgi:hypothetical protein
VDVDLDQVGAPEEQQFPTGPSLPKQLELASSMRCSSSRQSSCLNPILSRTISTMVTENDLCLDCGFDFDFFLVVVAGCHVERFHGLHAMDSISGSIDSNVVISHACLGS